MGRSFQCHQENGPTSSLKEAVGCLIAALCTKYQQPKAKVTWCIWGAKSDDDGAFNYTIEFHDKHT